MGIPPSEGPHQGNALDLEVPDSLDKIRIGISSCLLGEEVRFDGGHKRDSYVTGTLSQYLEFVPLCPEMAIGLGTPRQPIRLVGDLDHPRAVGVRDPDLDVTDALQRYGRDMGRILTEINGYILKRASPSCGMERVKVYDEKGVPSGKGKGIYAKALMEAQPWLPVEEEGRLGDPIIRENFLGRVFVYHRWRQMLANGLTPARLIDFHTDHKLLLMAHSQVAYRELGRLVSRAGDEPINDLAAFYVAELMMVLKRRVKRKHHVNVLQHLLGYLKSDLDEDDKIELLDTFEAYRKGLVPLIVPITLLKHHFRRNPDPYIDRQVYLTPHPAELMLRNAL